ncbi:hypothetical protein [Aquella oligotrophica]|uniref:Uncharacterized protein n=1 Tax=Aquella oligotrophica TaxID=2067065 RepID=A0A2I7N386_9NEIS|nr:hypothetical protein [Aquella oligotrophica]AUR50918.1 hypothetical protein CUN60_00900 [Aquella oligotrophica]
MVISIIAGCSKDTDNSATPNTTNLKVNGSSTPITLKLTIAPRIFKGINGDFTNVSFSIQEKPWHRFINGKLECTLNSDSSVICSTKDDLQRLIGSKTYRIIIFSQKNQAIDKSNDEIACDYFVYNPKQTPNLKITPTSSGECLIWQLKNDTGFSEEEIRTRVRHILNDSDLPENYDLALTLYNLYKSYDSEYDWRQALNKLTELIKTNKPLPPANKSKIQGSARVF